MPNFKISKCLAAIALLLACNSIAGATIFTFDTDPLAGTSVRNAPGRQIVGGELFINFDVATDAFAFNSQAFGINDIRFANAATNSIPSNANIVILESTDNDNNALTPFGAGNAADLIASRITIAGPGLFVYFNSSLNLARLVYSDDLSSNQADLKILARMLTLNGLSFANQITALPTISASDFQISEASSVPEPASLLLTGAGIALLAFRIHRHRSTRD